MENKKEEEYSDGISSNSIEICISAEASSQLLSIYGSEEVPNGQCNSSEDTDGSIASAFQNNVNSVEEDVNAWKTSSIEQKVNFTEISVDVEDTEYLDKISSNSIENCNFTEPSSQSLSIYGPEEVPNGQCNSSEDTDGSIASAFQNNVNSVEEDVNAWKTSSIEQKVKLLETRVESLEISRKRKPGEEYACINEMRSKIIKLCPPEDRNENSEAVDMFRSCSLISFPHYNTMPRVVAVQQRDDKNSIKSIESPIKVCGVESYQKRSISSAYEEGEYSSSNDQIGITNKKFKTENAKEITSIKSSSFRINQKLLTRSRNKKIFVFDYSEVHQINAREILNHTVLKCKKKLKVKIDEIHAAESRDSKNKFRCSIILENEEIGNGEGKTKKEAKNKASVNAVRILRNKFYTVKVKKEGTFKIKLKNVLEPAVALNDVKHTEEEIENTSDVDMEIGVDDHEVNQSIAHSNSSERGKSKIEVLLDFFKENLATSELVFQNGYTQKEERAIKRLGNRRKLSVFRRGKGQRRRLIVRKPITANKLLEHLIEARGSTLRFNLEDRSLSQ